MALWLAWTLFVVYGSTIPFHFVADREALSQRIARLEANPFVTPGTGRRVAFPDAVSNVLLYVPFGVAGSLVLQRKGVSRASRKIAGMGLALSCVIEVLQVFTADRVAATSDVLFNTVGSWVGASSARAMAALAHAGLRELSRRGLLVGHALYPSLIALIAVALSQWEPFDASLDVGEVFGKVRGVLRDPVGFTGLNDEPVSLTRCFLAGLALRAWLGETRYARDAGRIAAISLAAFAFLLEGSQLFVSSRTPGLEDALVMAAGGYAGARWGGALLRAVAPGVLLALLVAATAVGVATASLSPFVRLPVHAGLNWFPFWNYYRWTNMLLLSHTIEVILLYLPLGFCAALLLGRQGPAGAFAASATLLIAVPLEYLQGWFGRSADVTDVGMSLLGAASGVWAAGPGWAHFDAARKLLLTDPRQKG